MKLVPQTHQVTFSWLAAYVVGFWGVVIYYPTVRNITLRAGLLPFTFGPRGIPHGFSFNPTMSRRISRTRAYAEAVLSDVEFARGSGGLFAFDSRLQGRYAIRTRDLDEGALVAVLDFKGEATPRRVHVFRRRAIPRESERVEVDGLSVPGEVTPFISGLFLDPRFPSELGQGI